MDNWIIFAENSRKWYQINPEHITHRIVVKYDDYQGRHWWEEGIYYDYEYDLYHNKETGKYAIIASFWDIRGKLLSCGDCAMTKLWYVKEFEYLEEENAEKEFKLDISQMLNEYEMAVPHTVFVQVVKELDKELGIKRWNEEELIKL